MKELKQISFIIFSLLIMYSCKSEEDIKNEKILADAKKITTNLSIDKSTRIGMGKAHWHIDLDSLVDKIYKNRKLSQAKTQLSEAVELQRTYKKKTTEAEISSVKRLNELREKYIGFKYIHPQSLTFIKENGQPETLEGTNNNYWYAYFPVGDFTILSSKSDNTIKKITIGRSSTAFILDESGSIYQYVNKELSERNLAKIISHFGLGRMSRLKNTPTKHGGQNIQYYELKDITIWLEYMYDKNENITNIIKNVVPGKIKNLDEI